MKNGTAPADTRMMGIVHAALRRDLLRIQATITAEPYPTGRQRQALGEHVVWLMQWLHSHHSGEDVGLWPLVRERNPAAVPLLESMEAEHRAIVPAAAALTAAGQRYASTTTEDARQHLVEALDQLIGVVLPHLDREVAEAMPVVSRSISQADWDAVEQRYNVKPKSFRELGMEGHWILDGIDPEGYQVVVHTVPAVPRFILLHGFARAYRRQAQRRWRPDRSAAQLVTRG
jgi:hemerythrin-like domain-containing protein